MSDKYKNCFKSQAGMWIHLLAGKKIRCVEDMQVYELEEDGNLHTCYNPNMPGIWEPYEEPKWYENIPQQGILCWGNNGTDTSDREVVLIVEYKPDCLFSPEYKYRTLTHGWKEATPLTFEEAVNLIYNPRLTKN